LWTNEPGDELSERSGEPSEPGDELSEPREPGKLSE